MKLSSRASPWVGAGIFAGIMLITLGWAAYTHHVWEDFYITYRSSKNLALGNGLVFTAGGRPHTSHSPPPPPRFRRLCPGAARRRGGRVRGPVRLRRQDHRLHGERDGDALPPLLPGLAGLPRDLGGRHAVAGRRLGGHDVDQAGRVHPDRGLLWRRPSVRGRLGEPPGARRAGGSRRRGRRGPLPALVTLGRLVLRHAGPPHDRRKGPGPPDGPRPRPRVGLEGADADHHLRRVPPGPLRSDEHRDGPVGGMGLRGEQPVAPARAAGLVLLAQPQIGR